MKDAVNMKRMIRIEIQATTSRLERSYRNGIV